MKIFALLKRCTGGISAGSLDRESRDGRNSRCRSRINFLCPSGHNWTHSNPTLFP